MRTFIINLKESTDRRQYMINEMKKTNLEYEFFDAVNGRNIRNIDEIYLREDSFKKIRKILTYGEIGCAMSHLLIYKKMIDENIEQALILEDDIIVSNDFKHVFNELLKIKKNNYVILLGQSDPQLLKKIYRQTVAPKYSLVKIFDSGYGTYGYIIDNAAARVIYSMNYPVLYEADRWNVFWKFIDIYVLLPYIINYDKDSVSMINSIESRTVKKAPNQHPLIYIFFRKSFSLAKKIIRAVINCCRIFIP